jgi:hypothetical protein
MWITRLGMANQAMAAIGPRSLRLCATRNALPFPNAVGAAGRAIH